MDWTCGLVEKLRDLVLNLTWEHLCYLVECHENIEKLNGLLEELTLERCSVQHQIDEDANNGREIEDKVHHWLGKVNGISEKVRELQQEENQAKTRSSLTSSANLWLRYKLSKSAKELAQEVAEIKRGGKIDKFSYRRPPQWMPELTNRESNGRIDSRVSIMNEAMGALQDPNIKIIGLWGLGGVGKTTIAREAAKKARDENIFAKVVEVVVPKDLNVGDIQGKIAGWLGMTLDHQDENIRASYLCNRLMKEKNLLLIMDDLWGKIGFAQVGIPFKQEGCKILLTSRDENLLRNGMECERIIRVGVLSDDESWELFKGIAELSKDQNGQELIDVARDIARKCKGLPLAIVVLAKALREKDLREWKDALKQLESLSERDIMGEVDLILKLSYDHLRPEYKPIFLLSAMLSHDPSIRDLLMYSMGLGLLKRGENMEDAQNAIFTIVQKLKTLSLLLDGFSSDHFTIHDCFRDVALNIASADQNAFIRRHRGLGEWPKESSLERICWEKCDIISDLPEELRSPRLKLFFLNSKNRDLAIPDTFFKSTDELRVLSFINVCFSSLPSLGSLKKLRTLCLHSCRLEDITKVGSLEKLTILSLAYSEIEQLPSELACLTSLQMLNLAHCSGLKVIAPGILSSLKKLQVLCMEQSFCGWEAKGSGEGNENASLDELKELPISSLAVQIPDASILPKDLFSDFNLERHRIVVGEVWGDKILVGKRNMFPFFGYRDSDLADWEWEGNFETSKTLKLALKSFIHLEAGVRKLFEGVEDLYIKGSNGFDNVLCALGHLRFRNLKHIYVSRNDDITYIAFHSERLEVAFPILETMVLVDLKGLENLCQGPIPRIFFQNLKVVIVESCDHLKSIFSISRGGSFSRLELIQTVNCKSLTEIVNFNLEDSSSEQSLAANIIKFDQLHSLKMKGLTSLTDFSNDGATDNNRSKRNVKALFNHKVLFPKMKLLRLSGLNSMISSIWNDQLSDNSFSNLRVLVVRQCGFVKLIPFQVVKSLNNLEELEVWDCKVLEMVFDLEDFNADKETPQSSSVDVPLKRLKLRSLPKLKNVWSNHHNKGNVLFQSLRQVEVCFCESLTSVFPEFVAKCMQRLEELEIRCCDIEVIVARDQVSESVAPSESLVTFVFSRLTSLYLCWLRSLRNFYPQRHKLEWPHLQELYVIGCGELEIFEKTVSSLPEIYEEGSILGSRHPLLSHDKELSNLEDLRLDIKVVDMMGSGQYAMPYFSKVKILALHVNDETSLSDKPFWSSFPSLERLTFECSIRIGIRNPPYRWDDVDVGAAPFQKVYLRNISNKNGMVPCFFSLTNVTHLDVTWCSHLTALLTSSASRSLGNLTWLRIQSCSRIEKIITKQGGEDDEDHEIIFRKLQHLELIKLDRLRSFCGHNYSFEFPLLENVTIEQCPHLTMFCRGGAKLAPRLKSIKVSEFSGESIWMSDLNNTIQHFFTAPQVIATTTSMVLNATNITAITDVFPEVDTLFVENFFNKGITFPYNSLERFPRLNELHVEHSSFEEIFPSQDQITDIPPFEALDLAYLDQLKRIWRDGSQLPTIQQDLECVSVKSCCSSIELAPSFALFQNLKKLTVSTCHQLIYLVTCSTAKSLVNLRNLEISCCERMEEIIKNETNDDVEVGISFNELTRIKLTKMPSLKMFSPQSHTFKFPELEKIKIAGCSQMKKFCGGVEAPKLCRMKVEDHDMEWKDKAEDVNKTIEMLLSAKDGVNI